MFDPQAPNQAHMLLLQQMLDNAKLLERTIIQLSAQIGVSAIDNQPVLAKLDEVIKAIIAPTLEIEGPEFQVHVITVDTASTPVQGPNIPLLDGTRVIVRQRYHSSSPTGYVAGTQGAVSQTLQRTEIRDNDSFTVRATNTNKLWFSSDTDTTRFEILLGYTT